MENITLQEKYIKVNNLIKFNLIPILKKQLKKTDKNKKLIIDTIQNKNIDIEQSIIEYKWVRLYYDNIILIIYRRDNIGFDIKEIDNEFDDYNFYIDVEDLCFKIRELFI